MYIDRFVLTRLDLEGLYIGVYMGYTMFIALYEVSIISNSKHHIVHAVKYTSKSLRMA